MISRCCNAEIYTSSLFNRCLRCTRDVEVKTSVPSSSFKRKGKVILATIHGRTEIEGADIHLFAVGKPKGETYFKWWKHTPGLAPTRELVTFTKEHNRKGRLEGWFDRYTESLLDEWMTREDSIKAFKHLRAYLDADLTVAIACYCDIAKREFCHLSILRDLLEDMGYLVEEATPIKYK
jgi:hypothetical protein